MEGIVINAGAQNTLNPNMIAQESGNSPYLLMSQKAITNLMSRLSMSSPRILNAPIFIEDLVYTGEEITPAFYGYDEELMEIGGQTSAADAGVYTATFTPKDDCMWTDGTQRTIECTWKIGKAAGFCEAATHTVRLKEGTSFDIPFSHYEGAEIKVTTSNEPTATATVSGGTITVTAGHVRGTAKITVESVESDNWTSAKAEIDVTCLEMLYVPAQNGTLTYNGAEQAPTWSNAADSAYTKKGVESATNAGTYIVEFTPKTGYCWIDGTENTKEVSWTIQKAEGTLTIARTDPMTFGVGNFGGFGRSLTCNSDGTISSVADDANIVRTNISASRSAVNVYPLKKGTTPITVSVADAPNYITPKPVQFIVNCNIPSSNLSECTWAEIRSATDAGVADKLWQVGDITRYVRLKGQIGASVFDEMVNFRIVNLLKGEIFFQLAQNADGIEIGLCDALTPYMAGMDQAAICMNRKGQVGLTTDTSLSDAEKTYGTNKGGFGSSYMFKKVMDDYDHALPEDVRAVIKTQTRPFDNVGQQSAASSSIKYETVRCWLLSIVHVLGVSTNINPYMANSCIQLQYYAAGNRPFIYRSNNTTIDTYQWTCDPALNSNIYFVMLRANYSQGTWDASRSIGIRPVFVV